MFSEEGYEKTYEWALRLIKEYPNCNMLIWQAAVMLDARRITDKCTNPEKYLDYFSEHDPMKSYYQGRLLQEQGKIKEAYEKYENIIFSLDLLCTGSMDALSSEFFEPFLAGTIGFEHLVCCDDEHYPVLSSCLNHIDSISSSFPKGYRLAIKGALFTFFYTIFTNSTDIPAPKNDPHIERLKSVLKYIETNYMNTISIDEISSVSGFSASHFMRFFKSAMGTSFTSYLSSYRLSMAARLLLLTNDSILDIALSCGYENLSYFNRSFKKRYKKTPSEYRRGSDET